MKKLVLFFLTVYDNWIRNIILLVGCFLSCVLLLGILYCADEYNTVFSYARNGHIKDYVFVSDSLLMEKSINNDTSSLDSDYTLEDALQSMGGVEVSYFVANLQVVDLNRFNEEGGNLMLNLAYPGTPSFNDMKQKIAEGRLPEARNEIVLSHEAKVYYSLGETVELGYIVFHENGSVEFHPMTAKVVGFMPENPITKDAIDLIFPDASLETLFNRESYYTGYIEGFIGQPFDYTDDGVPIELRFGANIKTCRATNGRTAEELYKDILKEYPGLTQSIITGSALREHYWQEKRPIILKLLIIFILSIMLFVCFLIGSLYLQAREKSLEMCVLYAHGMTWSGASFLVCASYFPGILLGMICGIYFFFANAKQRFGLYCRFQLSYVAWTCLICIGISMLCTLSIYVRMARQSPVEVIRKD